MTVTATARLRSNPRSAKSVAANAINRSPSTIVPRSSTAINRSPSPSKAIPTSTCKAALTAFDKPDGDAAPHSALMFVPLGESFITTTSAPTALNTAGATLLIAPLAQSKTTAMPCNLSAPTIETRWSIYACKRSCESCTIAFGAVD